MVIDDGDLFRSGVRPPEDNAPLVVDTDGMETRQVALKGFQTITGGNRDVMEGASLVQLDQLPQGDSGYCVKGTTLLRSKQTLSIPVGEGSNHEGAVALI